MPPYTFTEAVESDKVLNFENLGQTFFNPNKVCHSEKLTGQLFWINSI